MLNVWSLIFYIMFDLIVVMSVSVLGHWNGNNVSEMFLYNGWMEINHLFHRWHQHDNGYGDGGCNDDGGSGDYNGDCNGDGYGDG